MNRAALLRLLSVVLVLVGAWYFRDIVLYVVVAAVLSLIGRPLMKRLSGRKVGPVRISPAIAALTTLVVILGLFTALAWIFFPVLVRELITLSEADPAVLMALLAKPLAVWQHRFDNWGVDIQLQTRVQAAIREEMAAFFSFERLTGLLGRLSLFVGNLFVGLLAVVFITFHFLREPELEARLVLAFTPRPWRDEMRQFLHRVHEVLSAYFLGLMVQVVLVSAATYAGLLLIGVEDAFIIALFTGLSNMIPFLGPLMGATFGVVLSFSAHPEMLASPHIWQPFLIKLVAVFIVVQILDNMVFQPLIFSRVARAHPLEIFLVILAAAELAGVAGMLVAVPSYMLIRIALREFFVKFQRQLFEDD